MSTDVSGMIECRRGARLWGPDDEDAVWGGNIDLFLDRGNAYDGLACLFGIRNSCPAPDLQLIRLGGGPASARQWSAP